MTSTVKIPEGWIETTLGQLVKVGRGSSPRPIQDYVQNFPGIPWVKIADATSSNSRFITETGEFIKEEGRSTTVYPGDLIVSNSATPGIPKFMQIEACVHDGRLVFSDYKNIEKDYLYYFFLNYRRILEHQATGTVFKNLKTDIVRNLEIIIPENPQEQKAIAGVLSSFDDKIELLRAENQTLEEMGQTLFKERFGKYKVGDELPDGWKWGELGEIGEQITTRVKNEKERVVLSAVNSGNLVLSESYFSKQVFSEDIAKYITCDKGDFAYNPARINIGSIGRNFYWNGAVSPVYVVFRPKEKFGKYLEYIFKSERFKNHVEKYANGSVRQALNYDGFSRFELLIPNSDILEKFNENLEVFEKKIEENKKQIETLSQTRDQLLPKLMSGEVRVEF